MSERRIKTPGTETTTMSKARDENALAENPSPEEPAAGGYLSPFQAFRLASKRLSFLAFILAALFTLSGLTQYSYVTRKNRLTTKAELRPGADRIRQELAFTNSWNLSGFRRSEFTVPNYFILTRDGFQIEMGDFVPGLIDRVALVDDSIYEKPKTVTTEVGEKWRLFAKKLIGGALVLGILDMDNQLDDLDQTDRTIQDEASKFGNTLDEAEHVRTREINSRVDYAVLDDSGTLKAATAFIPLRILTGDVLNAGTATSPIEVNGNSFFLLQSPILDVGGKTVGRIVMVKDVTVGERAIASLVLFNFGLGGVCWLGVLLIIGANVIASEVEKRRLEISLEEALVRGEGQTIEFKEGISTENLPPAISAFANTNTGVIFIGVRDNREICGVMAQTPQEEERIKQKIRDVVQNRVDPLLIPNLKYFETDGKKVLRVSVPLGDRPPYLGNGIAYRRVLAAVVPAKADDIRKMR